MEKKCLLAFMDKQSYLLSFPLSHFNEATVQSPQDPAHTVFKTNGLVQLI